MSDTSVLLLNFLKTGYQALTSPTPAYANILFDTKWSRMDKYAMVIIEKMPGNITTPILGSNRFRYEVYKRVQLLTRRNSAINDLYNLESNIETIINTNPTGQWANGIDQLFVTNFTPVLIKPGDDQILIGETIDQTATLARSFAIIKMIYECYVG